MKLITQTYQKKQIFQEIPAPENVAVQNKHSFKKVHTVNNYLF